MVNLKFAELVNCGAEQTGLNFGRLELGLGLGLVLGLGSWIAQ